MNHDLLARRAFVALTMCAMLAGCATGPAFQALEPVPSDRAQIYIYRPPAFPGGVVVHKVTIDGQAQALSLPNGGWLRVVVPPGVHTVSVLTYENFIATSCGGAQVDLTAGETAFVANVLRMTQVSNRVYVLCTTALKPRDEALKDLAGLRVAQ